MDASRSAAQKPLCSGLGWFGGQKARNVGDRWGKTIQQGPVGKSTLGVHTFS